MSEKILFLSYGPHYFHKALAEFLNAKEIDILNFRRKDIEKIFLYFINSFRSEMTKCEILLCEGNFSIPGLYKYLPFRIFHKKIINISADPNLFYLKTDRMNFIKRNLMLKTLNKVDFFICVGEMESLILKEILPNAKYVIVYPFIEEKRYNELLKILPKQKFNHNILFIGNGPDWYCKGIDLLIKSFKEVKNYYKDANLYILGSWDDKIKKRFFNNGIHFMGFKDIKEYIINCSLYLHIGRGDTFPLSVIEALLGGVPAIVSEYTGSKEIVYKLRKDFVVPLDYLQVAERVIEYFELPIDEKIYLSKKAKELGKRYRKNVIIQDVHEKLERFLTNF